MKSRVRRAPRPPAPLRPQIHDGIEVRHCHGIEELEACVALEREVWKSADIDVVPTSLFVVAVETGGQVLGAFDGHGRVRVPPGAGFTLSPPEKRARQELVGFTMAIVGWRNGMPLLHSHMTAVREAFRDRGIGRQLKLFQRADALARGISLIEWTFDPFIARNAYFNFMRLGAITRRYLPNVYGITTSPLHASLPTDRLVAEWHLLSPRVRRALAGKKPEPAFTKNAVRISIPADWEDLKAADPARAAQVQTEIRAQFTHWLAKKYAAVAVAPRPSGFDYILEPWPDAQSAPRAKRK